MNLFVDSTISSCVVGDQCNPYRKSIGLTMNDLLRDQIKRNISFLKQSSLIKSTAGITMMMFIIGLVNGICSLTTFQNKELRKVGCVLYLFASSITSLLTISMFTIKFWFVILLGMNSTVNLSLLRTDCVFISPVLKLCLYIDGWLNVCVAIERTVNVFKGVTFDKKLSKRIARWIIFILPILIVLNLIHEPLHHQLIEYTHQKYKFEDRNLTLTEDAEYEIEHNVMCVTHYSNSVQIYNTISLFAHLLVPFIVNVCSAVLIIVGTARQRSAARKKQPLKEHLIEQMKEHKQLLISPLILFLLALPRLIIALLSGCVDPSRNPWLYLSAYFISFTPPMLIFTVYVLPSELYMKTFKESMIRCRRRFQ